MRFASATRPARSGRRLAEPLVPMINVVFLLLIFVLLTARLEAPPPVPVRLPDGEGGARAAEAAQLWVARDGTLLAMGRSGDAALGALASAGGRVEIRADAALPATEIVGLLHRLRARGIDATRLVTAPR